MNQKQADNFATWYHFIKDVVPEKNFNMDSFCDGSPQDIININKKSRSCGTTGCLAGYLPAIFCEFCYPSIDSFEPALLKNIIIKEEISVISKCPTKYQIISIKDYNSNITEDISEFFGIEYEDVRSLIIPERIGYFDGKKITKSFMLERMRDLADKYGWEIDYETKTNKNKKTTTRNRRRKSLSRT